MIACELFDYIEIACLYRYKVKLLTKDGSEHVGIATDTITGSREEKLVLTTSEQNDYTLDCDQIVRMQVLTEGARFKQVEFSN